MKPLAIDLFCAYRVFCIPSGKSYLGITKRGSKRRWAEHISDARTGKMTALHIAIREFGIEAFTVEEICCARDVADLCEVERILIRQYDTRQPNGYNGDAGGNQFSYLKTPESIERSAAKHRGMPRSPDASERAAQKIRGTVRSAETRAKMAAARTGTTRSPETRGKISLAKTGISCNSGEQNGQSKLNADQVREARTRLASGESQRSIARSFGIHYNAIWKIHNGLKWRSVV